MVEVMCEPGSTYLGGALLPWYVSRRAAAESIADRGFCDVQIAASDDPNVVRGAVPPVLLAKVDTVARATFCKGNASAFFEIDPDRVKWIFNATKGIFIWGGYAVAPAAPPGGGKGGIEPGGLSTSVWQRRREWGTTLAFGGALGLAVGALASRRRRAE